MLDRDLAVLYGVSTKQLNQQVQRNGERFPSDFMFQLTPEETDSLRSQFAISNMEWAADVRSRTLSPSRGLRCCPAYSRAAGRCLSTSRSCGPS
ncbi:MAG: ORF6N domain-containing protein [Candidatus Rokubacteria bacterium]|nr:ORF6N domain-containing protein [Candidatus Rokubacteria bacterium]